jgi:diguanylate cyclase (GGDEF)-like protein/PAS domain S-box-containing protein
MKLLSPIARICLGLVALLLTILILANAITDPLGRMHESTYRQRLALLENLAVQYSVLADSGQLETLRTSINSLVDRNHELVISAALRLDDGTMLAASAEHAARWVKPPGTRSTLAHAQVPIFKGNNRWATLEVSFVEAGRRSLLTTLLNSSEFRFVLIVVAASFGLFFFYMRRTLQYLDPSAVIPDRVKMAFNVVPAGIMLLDNRSRIVLVNELFRDTIAGDEGSMIGRSPADLPWHRNEQKDDFPWVHTLRSGIAQNDVRMSLMRPKSTPLHLVVSTSPIAEEKGKVRGVLVAFDDVTELDRANDQLRNAVRELEASHAEIEIKNSELVRLATRDPLTDCLNRRAFFERLEPVFVKARAEGRQLCCIMSDIDHFKRFNDQYGHAVGDQVIQIVARLLANSLRADDLLCRYGGEEYCVILPDIDIERAVAIAERIRLRIATSGSESLRTTERLTITSSFGVSAIALGAHDPAEIIDQADAALYASKQNGRNRVTRYDQINQPEHQDTESTWIASTQ